MPDPQAPEIYSPSYCNAIVHGIQQAVDNAISSAQQSIIGQRAFIEQSINHINEALAEGAKDFEKNEQAHKDLTKCVISTCDKIESDMEKFKKSIAEDNKKTRMTMYGGAIIGLILFIGSQWAIISYLISMITKHNGS